MFEPDKIKKLNFVVVPRVGRSFYNVVVSYHLVYILVVAGILIVGTNLYLILSYFGMRGRVTDVHKVQQMDTAVLSLKRDAESIQRDIQKIKEVSKRIQNKTGISSEPGFVDYIRTDEDQQSLPSRAYNPELDGISQRLSMLRGEVEARKRLVMQVEGKVDQMVDRYNHMPSFNPLGGGRISSVFGYRVHPITGSWEYHEGLDINGKSGAPIYSTAEGTVVFSGWRQGYGVCVGIDHGNGFSTLYAHNTRNIVYEGEHVKKGQIIGYVGSTGSTTGVHCHYEVHFQNRAVDPARFLSLDIKDAERY